MKVHIFSLDGKPFEEIELPPVFDTELRPDVIKRAVLAAQTARLQPWGADVMAGKRTSAETWGKGFGVSRTRRVKGTRYPAAGMGAFSPHTVGGRRAHPPKVEKVLRERINRKERRLAIRSAIAATKEKKLISSRGHVVDGVVGIPVIVTDEFEKLRKASDVRDVIKKLGLWGDIERVKESKRIRAGRGKVRGRRYKEAVGPLLVVNEDGGIVRGARNFPGVEVVKVSELDVETLAPGGKPGRLTLWTKGAIQKLTEGVFS
ncbi:MAG: 50S ribosomal protein L4 [Hadesarchaea archaeon]|nr:MAG: 50S ribosomal protein L4 [Hadesarchaea archaeon]HDI12845.1 50S ribosomal protein L4 [Hadesarchaea archaeon]